MGGEVVKLDPSFPVPPEALNVVPVFADESRRCELKFLLFWTSFPYILLSDWYAGASSEARSLVPLLLSVLKPHRTNHCNYLGTDSLWWNWVWALSSPFVLRRAVLVEDSTLKTATLLYVAKAHQYESWAWEWSHQSTEHAGPKQKIC